MAKIAVLNDTPEVVVLLSGFLTRGNHEFFRRIGTSDFVIDGLVAFRPDVIIVPMYRRPAEIGRSLNDYQHDILGATMLARLSKEPRLEGVPIIVFGFSTIPEEITEEFKQRVRFDHFLTFPDGLQELNPLISGLVGPAFGTKEDAEAVRSKSRRHREP